MRLISVKQATNLLKKMCTSKNRYRVVKLLTAKKDRSITVKNDGSRLMLVEDGYRHSTATYSLVDSAKCRHTVQSVFKEEFPRSHRVYLEMVTK